MKKIFSNIKQFIKKISNKEYIKEHINYVVLGILIFVFLVSTLVYFLVTRSVSDIEKNKIINETTPYVNYINEIQNRDSDLNDKYIMFALKYHYYEKRENSLTSTEIKDFINNVFDKDLKVEDIKSVGITPYMVDNKVVYDSSKDSYTINIDDVNIRELEDIPIVFYKRNDIKKTTKSKYTVTYTKYVIEKPLELFNDILEYNATKENTEDLVDISNLKEYLQTGNYNKIMTFLNDTNYDLSKSIKNSGTVKIVYTLSDNDKLKIYEIK